MAAVTPVASVEALERAIQRSGLLSADALAKVHDAAMKAAEPKQLARDLIKNGTLTRWQAEQLLHGFHRLIVDKYKLLDQIAASPTGRVYLAEHVQIGRRHALKVLAKRLASNPEAVKRFLAAAQTACGLDHRNVSHCYDVNQDHERQSHYVVMEYVEGQSLERLVERTGRLDTQLALNFAVQTADGLIHAHQHGVVHGDLKPGNLVLDPTGTIKILEMGQASAGATFEAEGADESVEMAALAAVIFQSPELRGDGEAPSIACDIYSLGSVLTFLLTAKAAPDATTAVERLKHQRDIPPELIGLCGAMMADKPTDRPRTVSEVADQLVACAQKLAAAELQAAATAASEMASATTKGKARKPPVARPLDGVDAASIVIPGVTQAIVEPEAVAPVVIKTRSQTAKKSATQPIAEPTHSGDPSEPAATSAQAMFTPLVWGAIGGGVFVVLGLVIAIVCLLLFVTRRAKTAVTQTAPAAASAGVTPSAAIEESNPAEPTEQNPGAKPVPVSEPAVPTTESDAVDAVPQAAEPADESQPLLTPEPSAEPSADKAPPAPKSKSTTPPSKPASKPAVKPPVKPAAKPEPFQGLAKAIALPALPDQSSQAAPAAGPLVLGPCRLDDETVVQVKLVGGDTAVRGTKHRFELQPSTETRNAWDIVISGAGPTSTIAALTADGKNLQFQWGEEAGKQAAIAKQLANCVLQLAAGVAKHTLALRVPIVGPPLMLDVEKPGATTRWAIGDLPPAKLLYLEVVRAEGPKAITVDPKQPAAIGEDINISFGESAELQPVVMKLDSSTNSRDLEIKQQPYIKLEGQELHLYRRKDVQPLHQQTLQQIVILDAELKRTKDSRPRADIDKKLRDQKLELLSKQRLDLGTILEQITFATSFAEDYKGTALVHVRVYYQAGEEKVELLRTLEAGEPTRPSSTAKPK